MKEGCQGHGMMMTWDSQVGALREQAGRWSGSGQEKLGGDTPSPCPRRGGRGNHHVGGLEGRTRFQIEKKVKESFREHVEDVQNYVWRCNMNSKEHHWKDFRSREQGEKRRYTVTRGYRSGASTIWSPGPFVMQPPSGPTGLMGLNSTVSSW